MQKAKGDATKLVPNKSKLLVYLPLLLVIFGLVILMFAINSKNKCDLSIDTNYTIKCISLEIADTNESRTLGLSGREQLEDNQGMMFVFEDEATRCFWMKDMKFDLDMVWLNSDKKIVAIETGVRPDSYPKEYCYDNSQYVLEINSGKSQVIGLDIGQQLSF